MAAERTTPAVRNNWILDVTCQAGADEPQMIVDVSSRVPVSDGQPRGSGDLRWVRGNCRGATRQSKETAGDPELKEVGYDCAIYFAIASESTTPDAADPDPRALQQRIAVGV